MLVNHNQGDDTVSLCSRFCLSGEASAHVRLKSGRTPGRTAGRHHSTRLNDKNGSPPIWPLIRRDCGICSSVTVLVFQTSEARFDSGIPLQVFSGQIMAVCSAVNRVVRVRVLP